MSSILDAEDFTRIIQNKYGTSSIKIISTSLTVPYGDIHGFMGEYYKLTILHETNHTQSEDTFFVKTIPIKNQFQHAVVTHCNSYLKETAFYGNIITEFNKRGYHTRFVPKPFLSKQNSTVVLEDLNLEGFRLFGKNKFLDVDHCQAVLRSLAYLHANSILLEEARSKELSKPYRLIEDYANCLAETFFVSGDNGVCFQFFESTKKCVRYVCELNPNAGEWRDDFLKRLDHFNYLEEFHKKLPYRKTVCHGDLWSNNFMFKDGLECQGGLECRLLDFQVVRYHHPGYDVSLAIGLNTKRDFREGHSEGLKEYYYGCFEKVLGEYGVVAEEVLSRGDFLKSCEEFRKLVALQAVAIKTCMVFPVDLTNMLVKNGDSTTMQEMMFDGRVGHMKKYLEGDQGFKDSIFDEIYELNECLRMDE